MILQNHSFFKIFFREVGWKRLRVVEGNRRQSLGRECHFKYSLLTDLSPYHPATLSSDEDDDEDEEPAPSASNGKGKAGPPPTASESEIQTLLASLPPKGTKLSARDKKKALAEAERLELLLKTQGYSLDGEDEEEVEGQYSEGD